MAELQNIRGLDEVKRTLAQFSKELQDEIMQGATREAAKVLQESAQSLAQPRQRPLIRVIKLSETLHDGQWRFVVAAQGRTAHLLEFGGKSHEIAPNIKSRTKRNASREKSGKGASIHTTGRIALRIGDQFMPRVRHPGISARPFMRPAFDRHAVRALNASVEYIRKRIEKIRTGMLNEMVVV